ncbi:hypothetical protein Tco_1199282 [Tanacetum coccineum]
MDENTKNGKWNFFVNEYNTEGSISNTKPSKDECDEHYKKSPRKSSSDSFFKPYLDAQEGNGIYNFEESNHHFPQILVPAKVNFGNPNELCKSEEFVIVRYLIGIDEEFITLSPGNYNAWVKTHESISSFYHDLFNKKFRGWMQYDVSLGLGYGILTTCTDLAIKKSTIWYTLKKTCVELVRAF